MKTDTLFDFVKTKLEEDEGISREALARLLAAADQSARDRQPETDNQQPATNNWQRATALLAASLAVAACGWFFYADADNARRESNLANVIDLLRAADGETASESASLSDNLLAWQDAPTLADDGE